MQQRQPWKARTAGTSSLQCAGHTVGARLARAGVLAAFLGLALCAAGCSSITTPLPDLSPRTSTAMSQQEHQRAMKELTHKRDTHEEDAERQIEAVK